jgi:regulator of protease activity HflC (stomatin/prohibitin superfamily)
MQALIDFIIRNLLQLWPIARVYSWQVGCRVRGGIVREELGPGLHWRWWFIDEVEVWPGTVQGIDLATATITTADGLSVSVSANVQWRVTSMRQMKLGIWNTVTTLGLIALGEIATRCASQSWPQLKSNRAALESDLRGFVNARIATWGVEVSAVNVTDMIITRGHRHYVDGMEKSA